MSRPSFKRSSLKPKSIDPPPDDADAPAPSISKFAQNFNNMGFTILNLGTSLLSGGLAHHCRDLDLIVPGDEELFAEYVLGNPAMDKNKVDGILATSNGSRSNFKSGHGAVFVGNLNAARSLDILKERNITRIVNCLEPDLRDPQDESVVLGRNFFEGADIDGRESDFEYLRFDLCGVVWEQILSLRVKEAEDDSISNCTTNAVARA